MTSSSPHSSDTPPPVLRPWHVTAHLAHRVWCWVFLSCLAFWSLILGGLFWFWRN